jgi:iron-sulfur cluster repair protein YtfE (RIC family)
MTTALIVPSASLNPRRDQGFPPAHPIGSIPALENRSVLELLLESPRRVYVLEQFDLPYASEPDEPLSSTCIRHGVSIQPVIAALTEADTLEPRFPAQTPGADAASLPIPHLIDFIRSHHRLLSTEMTLLGYMLNQVAERHGGSYPELWDSQGLFTELEDHLYAHIALQEHGLFPALLRPETLLLARHLPSETHVIMESVATLKTEHLFFRWAFAELREWTHGFIPAECAYIDQRVVYSWLANLSRQLETCWRLEELLISRAEKLCL